MTDRLALDTSPDQTAAIALYESRGYEVVEEGEIAGYDDVRMARSVV